MTHTTSEQIEFLCHREYPDYQAVRPERVQALSAMTMPGPGSGDPASEDPISRGRSIPTAEQERILAEAAAFTAELRTKSPEEVDSLYKLAQLNDWRADKLTIDQTAVTIAAKIFPDDGYPWTVEQRKECEDDYRIRIKKLILCGSVPLINPYTKQDFDHTRLSKDRFPEDGLLKVGNIYRCLTTDHAKKGYFPSPPASPARVSKAPPPITPPTLAGYPSAAPPPIIAPKFDKPNWSRWFRLDRAYLWEAACLAANIEPPRPHGHEIGHLFELKRFPPAFFAVWEAVNRDAFFSAFEMVGTCGRMLHTINLDGFAYWAVEKGFDVAPEFKEIAAHFKPSDEIVEGPTTQPAIVESGVTKNKLRTNLLDVPIKKAIQQANSRNTAAVYLKLKELALNDEPPFTGEVDGPYLYYTNGNNKRTTLTIDNLRKRIKRL